MGLELNQQDNSNSAQAVARAEIETGGLMAGMPKPVIWFEWASEIGHLTTAVNRMSEDEKSTMAGLGLDPVVLPALRLAFEQGLNRTTGWDISSCEPIRQGLLDAASIYKRGVGTHDGAGPFVRKFRGGESAKYRPAAISYLSMGEIKDKIKAASCVIIDANVAANWTLDLVSPHLILDVSEETKNLATTARCAAFLRECAAKQVTVIGGGVLSDVAGFAASLVGAETTLIPTTLLAMVDAAHGGKTGVNFEAAGKNQVGVMHFPKKVLVCTEWLSTLPERHWFAGGAEALKHGIISGDEALQVRVSEILRTKDYAAMTAVLPQIVSVKEQIVASDPFEKGERALLNFGHTLGHALEYLSQQEPEPLLHGEAVAVGMKFALDLAKTLGRITGSEQVRLSSLIQSSGCLPHSALLGFMQNEATKDRAIELIFQDKKNVQSHTSRWVLPPFEEATVTPLPKEVVSMQLSAFMSDRENHS